VRVNQLLSLKERGKQTARPQVKVCGVTNVAAAESCADLGVDAIGCVFYPKSPRYIPDDLARDISNSLPPSVQRVGVFVDNTFSQIMQKVEHCRLTAVQLHGREPKELVGQLRNESLLVIKALFIARAPSLNVSEEYQGSVFLVEQGKGSLPGGNAEQWDWSRINRFGRNHPLILAGGLSPGNVADAVASCVPDAVDVSSGVESAPGVKDTRKVEAFLKAVSQCTDQGRSLRAIFQPNAADA